VSISRYVLFKIFSLGIDFLLDIMNRQGAQQSMAWLGPIILHEPDTLQALPTLCLCELLLISQSESEANKYP
jgi:integrator complex subunit 1